MIGADLRLHLGWLDYVLVAGYFVVVLAIGVIARRSVATSEDFFLSGRSLPAWITGLAFISANLGAIEILGMAANGAQYGVSTVHFYWVGAVPAMVFLALIMMPFYYGSKVHSVPEYLRRRFGPEAHLFNAFTFAAASVLIAGVNLYALALVIHVLIGWSTWVSIVVAAAVVLSYISLGGLSGAIYNEVLQFFVIVAGLVPLVIVGLDRVGGWSGLRHRIEGHKGGLGSRAFETWGGTSLHGTNPIGDWIGIVFGLGFVLSFGYWTTNFAEVQRALSAKDSSAARRTSLIGAFPKIFIPALTIIPGLIALSLVPDIGQSKDGLAYNDVLPYLIGQLLPTGVLGIALTGLLASFMAGMAANVSAFNTVWTYDIWKPYVRPDEEDGYYVRHGRLITAVGVLIGVGTAFLAGAYSNLMNYIQLLYSFFNAPLFATFLLAVFWRRTTPKAGLWGLVAGTIAAGVAHVAFVGLGPLDTLIAVRSPQNANFYGALFAFAVDAAVSVAVSLVTEPKPEEELDGLVWGKAEEELGDPAGAWWENVWVLSAVILVLTLALTIAFL